MKASQKFMAIVMLLSCLGLGCRPAHRVQHFREIGPVVEDEIDKGRIVETGTHQELMDQKGLYQYLYNLKALQIESELDSIEEVET